MMYKRKRDLLLIRTEAEHPLLSWKDQMRKDRGNSSIFIQSFRLSLPHVYVLSGRNTFITITSINIPLYVYSNVLILSILLPISHPVQLMPDQ